MIDDALLNDTLRRHFGHADFRPGQRDVIRAVLEGRPTLAVMPTGAGKSLCYQLPALLLRGLTLVVSPLVALMKDQVDGLSRRGIPAACLHSAQDESERAEAERDVEQGRSRLVFVAPERFRSTSFHRLLRDRPLSLLAVDEAHCISEWGHSFRPDYERLGDVVAELRPRRLLALTATASPDVRADIVRALRMDRPVVTVAGFDRPNIHLEVHRLRTEAEKRDTALRAVRAMSPAIVYAATRRQCDALTRHFAQQGVPVGAYHAGLEPEQRDRTQDAFLAGRLQVVVATNAFGMGVDKPDVRLVVHSEVPRAVEAYYQELGRAGRDGQPAVAATLFLPKDLFLQRHLLSLSSPEPRLVTAVVEALRHASRPLVKDELRRCLPARTGDAPLVAALAWLESIGLVERRYGARRLAVELSAPAHGESTLARLQTLLGGARGLLDEDEAVGALGLGSRAELDGLLRGLQRAGAIVVQRNRTLASYVSVPGRSLSKEDLGQLSDRASRDRRRFDRMLGLVCRARCRRASLLEALGEQVRRRRCGACDVCAGHRLAAVRSQQTQVPDDTALSWTVSPPIATVASVRAPSPRHVPPA